MHGDLVLADCGFDISDELTLPPFTKGKSQLSQREVEESRSLSRISIHVEHVIGRLKIQNVALYNFPITLVKDYMRNHMP